MAEARVFLVEDDAIVRKGCEQALSLADIAVRGFADAEQFHGYTSFPMIMMATMRP